MTFKATESLKSGAVGSINIKLWEGEIEDPIADTGNEYTIIPFYVTEKAQWGLKGDGGNNDWTKGNFNIGLDLVGKMPKPTNAYGSADGQEVDFAYNIAFFLVDSYQATGEDVEPATLLGVGGPGGVVFNK